MVNAGGDPDKPVWSGFRKSKPSLLLISCVIVFVGAVYGGYLLAAQFQIPSQLFQALKPTISPSPTPKKTTVSIRAVGDVMLGREVNVKSQAYNNFSWPFEQTIPHLPPTDIFLGNLEAPFYEGCPKRSDGMIFCAPPEAVSGLVFAKFTHLSLANNHSLNYGQDGYTQTLDILRKHRIAPLEPNQTFTTTIDDITIGFLALDDISSSIDITTVSAAITELKSKTHLVVVIPHWGHEYWQTPSARQEELAKTFIESGADIIIGAHPHVIQPIVAKENSLIAYSLGNFVFDQMWSNETREALILDLDLIFTAQQLTHITYQTYAATIFDYGQPRLNTN
jgi:poly-gamma-glutamate synthesis protein (capsule biosynthesis protein)